MAERVVTSEKIKFLEQFGGYNGTVEELRETEFNRLTGIMFVKDYTFSKYYSFIKLITTQTPGPNKQIFKPILLAYTKSSRHL